MPPRFICAGSELIEAPISLPDDASFDNLPPTAFDQFVGCVVLVVVVTTLFSFPLPRPLFFKLIKIAFPFLPERLERNDS